MTIDNRKAHESARNIRSIDDWTNFQGGRGFNTDGTSPVNNVTEMFYLIAHGEFHNNVIHLGMVHGPYMVYMVKHRDGVVRLSIGCRYFDIEAAYNHWSRRTTIRAGQIVRLLPGWISIARSVGWVIPDPPAHVMAGTAPVVQAPAPAPPPVKVNTDYVTVYVDGEGDLVMRSHATVAEKDAFQSTLGDLHMSYRTVQRILP